MPVLKKVSRLSGENKRFILPGAPVALRAGSSFFRYMVRSCNYLQSTSTRSFPALTLENNIGLEEFSLFRVFQGPFSMTGAVLYGWAKSPTWPCAVRDTNDMFDKIVTELALSRSGPRFILGDFNHDLCTLRGWEILQAEGWIDAQDYAWQRWGKEPEMTFRESSITDHGLALSRIGSVHH